MATLPRPARLWPSYAMVWRWHFYAGLFCIPFVLWLAVTGSIYLFRPQIEAALDRPYAHVIEAGAPRAGVARQAEAAVRAQPGSTFRRYQLPDTPEQAVQIVVGKDGRETRVYIHPRTLAILRTADEDSRPMRVVFRLHGELLLGDPGSYLVELAASWAIVMILSGLFLWWPRGRGPAGTIYPRLRGGGRLFWRDLHAVTGLWVSCFALFLLVSGLPWAKSWGSYLKEVRAVAAGGPVRQDWPTGHEDHREMAMPHTPVPLAPLDRLVATVAPLGLAPPVLIAPPAGPGRPWTARSDAADRPLRADLTLDPATGRILSRRDFADRPLVDRIVGTGVAAHEGQLFGWANQLLGLTTAIGLILLSTSAVVLWWRRRPADLLGAPPVQPVRPAALGFVLLLVLLGLFLPLLGVTMLAVLAIERIVLRRLPATRTWLGLRPAPRRSAPAPGGGP